jgi:hypothetical protein
MPLNANPKDFGGASCAACRSQSRNRQVYHILSFTDLEILKDHLNAVFPDNNFCQEFFINMWLFAHQFYGDMSKSKFAPLWLVYLESHGVTVKKRGEIIMKYRGENL